MPANHAIRLVATLLLLLFASASRAEDRTSIVETSLRWHVNPFQEGGYSSPGGYFNKSLFKGRATIVLDRDTACERMDQAFEKLGFKMKRDVAYRREGVEFVVTGYDAEKKLGYLWATTETLGEGYFGLHPETSDKEKAARLSAAEAKILEDRAPVTREFIAIVIPYTVRLGYESYLYRTDEGKEAYEKRGAETLEVRLAALDKAVGDYVQWVGALRAEDYPAPSPEPRNLLTFARWSVCRARVLPFGACPVGEHLHPPSDELVKKSIETCGAAAKLDLTAPYTYEKNGASLKFTGFDPQRKIGYLWDYPNEAKRLNDGKFGNISDPVNDAKHIKEVEALAKQAEADGLRIAWLSPADARFDNGGAPTLTIDSPPYAAKHEAILKITNRAERAEALRKLEEEIARENQPAIYRLERRMKEFVEWAEKP